MDEAGPRTGTTQGLFTPRPAAQHRAWGVLSRETLSRQQPGCRPPWAVGAVAWDSGLPGTLTYLLPETHYAGQEADEDVSVHAPLVGFVNDHHLVLEQQEVLVGEVGGEASQPGLSTSGSLCTPRCLLKEPLW